MTSIPNYLTGYEDSYRQDPRAAAFDASAIADFTVACEMKHINITTRHHEICTTMTEKWGV